MSQVTRQEQSQAAVAAGTRIVALAYYSICGACLLVFAAHNSRDLSDMAFLCFLLTCLGVGGWPVSLVVGDLIGSLACQLAGESTISPKRFAVALALTLCAAVISWILVLAHMG